MSKLPDWVAEYLREGEEAFWQDDVVIVRSRDGERDGSNLWVVGP